MMFWLIVLAVVVVVAALAWWTSGRKGAGGVDADTMRRSKLNSENDVSMQAGRPPGGGPVGPLGGS